MNHFNLLSINIMPYPLISNSLLLINFINFIILYSISFILLPSLIHLPFISNTLYVETQNPNSIIIIPSSLMDSSLISLLNMALYILYNLLHLFHLISHLPSTTSLIIIYLVILSLMETPVIYLVSPHLLNLIIYLVLLLSNNIISLCSVSYPKTLGSPPTLALCLIHYSILFLLILSRIYYANHPLDSFTTTTINYLRLPNPSFIT